MFLTLASGAVAPECSLYSWPPLLETLRLWWNRFAPLFAGDIHGSPEAITTDGLRFYRAAMKGLGNEDKREVGRWANNCRENSHLSFRRCERAMLGFRQMKALQKFASVHANVHSNFALERHLSDPQTYKHRRSAASAEWQSLTA